MIYWIVLSLAGLAAAALTVRAARRWPGDRYLCDDCSFNDETMCLKAERPKALVCLAYRKEDRH